MPRVGKCLDHLPLFRISTFSTEWLSAGCAADFDGVFGGFHTKLGGTGHSNQWRCSFNFCWCALTTSLGCSSEMPSLKTHPVCSLPRSTYTNRHLGNDSQDAILFRFESAIALRAGTGINRNFRAGHISRLGVHFNGFDFGGGAYFERHDILDFLLQLVSVILRFQFNLVHLDKFLKAILNRFRLLSLGIKSPKAKWSV